VQSLQHNHAPDVLREIAPPYRAKISRQKTSQQQENIGATLNMGLTIHSLNELPQGVERGFYVYLLDYGWHDL